MFTCFSKSIKSSLRKYDFPFEHMTSPRELIICFENIFLSLENVLCEMPCSLVKWKKRSDYTYCTYIIAFSVIAKVWLLVAVATARKLLVCAKGGNFRIWIFVYWMRKFHRILLPFTSLVVGRYVASKN